MSGLAGLALPPLQHPMVENADLGGSTAA